MNGLMSVAELTALMEAFSKNDMGELRLKMGDMSIRLKAKEPQQVIATAPIAAAGPQATPAPQATEAAPAQPEPAGNLVTSPIVGTFYAAPSPDKAPFASAGQQVEKGDVLFIIESMKLMNEVVSEFDGIVREILVENGQPVEYGQPIMRIE